MMFLENCWQAVCRQRKIFSSIKNYNPRFAALSCLSVKSGKYYQVSIIQYGPWLIFSCIAAQHSEHLHKGSKYSL